MKVVKNQFVMIVVAKRDVRFVEYEKQISIKITDDKMYSTFIKCFDKKLNVSTVMVNSLKRIFQKTLKKFIRIMQFW